MIGSLRRLAFLLALGFVLSDAAPLQAQSYPNKPIKIIVAAAAGGPDRFSGAPRRANPARRSSASRWWSRTARAPAARSARARSQPRLPDGYTLHDRQHQHARGHSRRCPPAPATIRSRTSRRSSGSPRASRSWWCIRTRPWKTVKDFVDDTKANPGKINYAHTGPGGLPHLAGELFMLRSGAKMTGVSYRSGGESVDRRAEQGSRRDVREHRDPARADPRGQAARACARRTRPARRSCPNCRPWRRPALPIREANTFFGLAAPAGTPASIIKKHQRRHERRPGRRRRCRRSSPTSAARRSPNSPAEFAAYIAAQHKKWVEVGKAADVKVN